MCQMASLSGVLHSPNASIHYNAKTKATLSSKLQGHCTERNERSRVMISKHELMPNVVTMSGNRNTIPRTAGLSVLHRIWPVAQPSSDAWAERSGMSCSNRKRARLPKAVAKATIRLQFDCNSTALRPFDDLHASTGLLQRCLDKQIGQRDWS